jgi:hypothetical protein
MTYLLFFNTILEDVLNNKTAGLPESDFMPHASKSFVDFDHDLRGFTAPAQFE